MARDKTACERPPELAMLDRPARDGTASTVAFFPRSPGEGRTTTDRLPADDFGPALRATAGPDDRTDPDRSLDRAAE